MNVKDWAQLISNLVLLVGIGLVIYELRLARDIAEAQITAEEVSRISALRVATFGETPHEALSRAARAPHLLTDADVVVLDAYYRAVILNWTGVTATRRQIGMSGSLEQIVRNQTLSTFTSEPGRAWLSHFLQSNMLSPEIVRVAQETLAKSSNNVVLERYQAVDRTRGSGDLEKE